jgi:hypothetical protein
MGEETVCSPPRHRIMQILACEPHWQMRAVHGPFPRSGIRPAVYGGSSDCAQYELQAPFMGLLAHEGCAVVVNRFDRRRVDGLCGRPRSKTADDHGGTRRQRKSQRAHSIVAIESRRFGCRRLGGVRPL